MYNSKSHFFLKTIAPFLRNQENSVSHRKYNVQSLTYGGCKAKIGEYQAKIGGYKAKTGGYEAKIGG